jgi:hypothetical protein
METTFTDNGHAIRADTEVLHTDAGNASLEPRDAGHHEGSNLIGDLQDLLGRIAHVAVPVIARLRTCA